MGDVPPSAGIACIGRIVFQLGRIYIDLHRGARDEEFTCRHGTKLILLIDVLGHIVNP